ncbi:hypothetical protein [Halocalculus aciditolerans]|uniref:hypothetical protein n=1 Tax=Halocalculus aciditolerans TaxID=1383812 RepID=UPI0016685092|nr:hypothetical protein [Halocalculus aciditolerans]
MSITSDVLKRVAWVVTDDVQVNGTAEVRLAESDGDYVSVDVSNSSDVTQTKLNDLAVSGSGDGSLSSVDSVKIVVSGGDADIELTQVRSDRLSMVRYGAFEKDIDSDNETERLDIYEPSGTYNVSSLSTMSSVFDSATIYDVEYDVIVSAATYGDVQYEFDEEAAEEYDRKFIYRQYTRLALPNVIELDYEGFTAYETVAYPTSRLIDAWYIEGSGSQTFDEAADSSAQISRVSAFEAAGDNATVTWDDSVQDGTTYIFYESWTTSQSDKDTMTDVSSGGGVGTLLSEGGSWLWGFFTNPLGAFSALIAALLGAIKRNSGGDGTVGE